MTIHTQIFPFVILASVVLAQELPGRRVYDIRCAACHGAGGEGGERGAGNPCPDYNGDQRLGDNLYSDSVVAVEPQTGKLRWYFQFTPHDLHDWDAQQTPMLVDANFQGRPRKLLVQANRNGFFYVLDRITGEFLLGKPFVEKLTWASGLDSKGRPLVKPESIPTPEGVTACPAVEGATNWMSTAFHPATGLFYVMALEKCNIFRKVPAQWEPGKSFYGGTTRPTGEPGRKFLRAIDPDEIGFSNPAMETPRSPGAVWTPPARGSYAETPPRSHAPSAIPRGFHPCDQSNRPVLRGHQLM